MHLSNTYQVQLSAQLVQLSAQSTLGQEMVDSVQEKALLAREVVPEPGSEVSGELCSVAEALTTGAIEAPCSPLPSALHFGCMYWLGGSLALVGVVRPSI